MENVLYTQPKSGKTQNKSNKPLVSIIIPVFNGANFLQNAIESALAQKYKAIEIIVVNDGSNDNNQTERVAIKFKNKIRYFKKQNGGVSSALNVGIKKMRGDYFSWLSHDDIYKPDKIQKQITTLNENEKFKIFSSDFESIHLIKKEPKPHKFVNRDIKIFKTGRDILSNWIFFSSMIIHKSCFEKVGLFDEDNFTCQDLDMQLRLVQYFPIFHLNSILLTHRFHSEQTSVRKVKSHIEEKNKFHKQLFYKYKLNFFSNDNNKFKTLIFLGDYGMKNDLIESACFYYKKALRINIISPKLLLLIIFKKQFFNFLITRSERKNNS